MSRVHLFLAGAAALFAGVALATVQPLSTPAHAQSKTEQLQLGQQVYEKSCLRCHGAAGRGDGPDSARFNYHARDFSMAIFKCRCTATEPPTDEDLLRTVTDGMPGTVMLSTSKTLSLEERRAVVQYVKTLSPAFKNGNAASCPAEPAAPAATPELVEEGKALYTKMGCAMCHGATGRGDGPSAASLKDAWGNAIKPLNFVVMRKFKCGGDAQDIYRTLQVGLAGTPMMSYKDALAAEAPSKLSAREKAAYVEHRTWALVQYILALAGNKT